MRCPICNYQDTKVVDYRVASDEMSIRRRRECEKCTYRFSTMEEMELLDLMVVKRDGKREPYSREKIERGLFKALEKRQFTDLDFKKLVHAIERDIQKKKVAEIRSMDLGEIVMNRLRGFDKVAYIRFASVYRSFEDVQHFQQELDKLIKNKTSKKKIKKQIKKNRKKFVKK